MIKLLHSNYDEASGHSYVKIGTDCGIFEGHAFLHPEDSEVASSFFGCEIAEYRATLEYFKKKLHFLNIRQLSLLDLKRDYKNLQKDSFLYSLGLGDRYCRILNKRICQNEVQIKEYKANIKSLKVVINSAFEAREKTLAKIQKNKEKDGE